MFAFNRASVPVLACTQNKHLRALHFEVGVRERNCGFVEQLFGLNREANGYFGRSVEILKDVIARQAAKLTLGSATAGYLHATIASSTLRTSDVALHHSVKLRTVTERA
jgi:hypothetical protein